MQYTAYNYSCQKITIVDLWIIFFTQLHSAAGGRDGFVLRISYVVYRWRSPAKPGVVLIVSEQKAAQADPQHKVAGFRIEWSLPLTNVHGSITSKKLLKGRVLCDIISRFVIHGFTQISTGFPPSRE